MHKQHWENSKSISTYLIINLFYFHNLNTYVDVYVTVLQINWKIKELIIFTIQKYNTSHAVQYFITNHSTSVASIL